MITEQIKRDKNRRRPSQWRKVGQYESLLATTMAKEIRKEIDAEILNRMVQVAVEYSENNKI